MDSRWQKIEEAVSLAADVPISQRQAWLEEFCDGDSALQSEIESLLQHQAKAQNFLEQPVGSFAAKILPADDGKIAGQKIGQYRIVREIGRGGMGVVYLAEREDQFRQQVAIKLVKRGLDTEDILHRFHNERQILASLNHPNIARLFDGGMTEDGLPYFVMEYIEGAPVTKYSDIQDFDTNQRLELFCRICAAVQHAHQNLIVHRDLKPSNILVTRDGEVKLLDFGVAKLLAADSLDGAPTMTQAAHRVMTPEYASPEQVRGQRVTTATDVYSLGVVLYELLTRAKPYKLEVTSPQELSKAICESEPTKPSEARSEQPASAPRSHARRRHPPANSGDSNLKELRGDLDNIILMALRKDPERRYKSVEQFSEDIRRHLEGQPVIARKDTFTYRTSKWIQRNRVVSAAAALIAITLLGGIVATTWQAQRARAHASLAEAKTREAQAALVRTEKINRFMQSIFSYGNPDWFGRADGRRDVSVLEAMRDVEKRIEEEFRDEPDLRGDVYQQMGDSYRTQGLWEDAERNLRNALSLRLKLYGEDNAKVAESMYILCGVYYQRGELPEWEGLLTKALSIQRRFPDHGNNLPYMIADYGNLLRERKNDYAGALALYREALELFRRRYGESHYMVGATQLAMVNTYFNLGDYAQAEATISHGHYKQHPSFLFWVLSIHAQTQIIAGDYQAAEDTIGQMQAQAQSQGAQPLMMQNLLSIRSFLAYRRGDYAQAVADAKRAFAALPSDRYGAAFKLAPSLNKLGQAKRAETFLLEEIERLSGSERVVDLAKLKSVLGESLTAQRRFTEAELVLLEAYAAQKARVLAQQFDFVETRQRLSQLYRASGRVDEAEKYESKTPAEASVVHSVEEGAN